MSTGLGLNFRIDVTNTETFTALTIFHEEVEIYYAKYQLREEHNGIIGIADAFILGYEKGLMISINHVKSIEKEVDITPQNHQYDEQYDGELRIKLEDKTHFKRLIVWMKNLRASYV